MRIICLLTVVTLGCGGASETKPSEAVERWEGQYAGECSDEADNDGDGLFDCDDSDCAGAPNCGEEEADLDADGTTDADADGGSAGDDDTASDADADADGTTGSEIDDYEGDEPGECGDGIDNDRDGIFDCTDPGCSSAPECSTTDTGETTDTDGLPPTDSDGDGDVDVDGGDGESSCDDEEASTEAGEGEMEIRGWLTISGDVDLSSASCKITTWLWSGISPTTGVPDLDGGAAMLGDACVDCPGVVGTAVPFTVILPVSAEGEEVGVIAKINADGRIYEQGTDSNPLMSASAGDAEGFRFEIDVVEPGPGDPLDPPDAGADLEPPDGPDAEPDMGAPGSGG